MDWQGFLFLREPNTLYVVIGSMLLAASTALVGCFAMLRKRSLSGDAAAHAVLPGIALAFLIFSSQASFILLLGAFFSSWLALTLLDFMVLRSRLKEDTATAVVLSVFFAIGLWLLTIIQHTSNASQSGLDRFIFGKASALVGSDLWLFLFLAILIIFLIGIFYRSFKVTIFNPGFARSIGYPVERIELLLSSMTVLAVIVGMQTVGLVLMAAMLITPAAAARFWTNRLSRMLLIAMLIGAFSGWIGAGVSYFAPSMPTGPWIVLTASFIAFASFLFAPKQGLWSRMKRQYKQNRLYRSQNLLLFLAQNTGEKISQKKLQMYMNLPSWEFRRLSKKMQAQGYILKENKHYSISPEGRAIAQKNNPNF
ncbi:MAG: metal ABC transporter permease [Bernardetiaceae bacterium]|nr:metal ABC transporter permease [Bernardetiaceae bacterium]